MRSYEAMPFSVAHVGNELLRCLLGLSSSLCWIDHIVEHIVNLELSLACFCNRGWKQFQLLFSIDEKHQIEFG